MKTKEEVIKDAYGVDWDNLSDETKESVINQNGNIFDYLFKRTKESPYYEMVGNGFARPISLRGIDDNNGWVIVKHDGDLPKDSNRYWVMQNNGFITTLKRYRKNKDYFKTYATHWQPIIRPKNPIHL